VISDGTKPVSNKELSEIVAIAPSTISTGNPFFADVGLILRAGSGYVAAPEVVQFQRAHTWSPETAATKLAPVLRNSWFGELLLRRLSFDAMPYRQALVALAEDAGAGPSARTQLEMLLSYLLNAGIIARDGDLICAVRPESSQAAPSSDGSNEGSSEVKRSDYRDAPPQSRSRVPFPHAGGGVAFNVRLQVEMSELATWSPERITAFFAGIAQVLAAKGTSGLEDVEEQGD
jgi:hypothetical protein